MPTTSSVPRIVSPFKKINVSAGRIANDSDEIKAADVWPNERANMKYEVFWTFAVIRSHLLKSLENCEIGTYACSESNKTLPFIFIWQKNFLWNRSFCSTVASKS